MIHTLKAEGLYSLIPLDNDSMVDELFDTVSHSNEHLVRYMVWAENYTRQSAIDFVQFVKSCHVKNPPSEIHFMIKTLDDICVGVIGLHNIQWDQSTSDIGYWVAKDHTGKGIATTSLKALVQYARDELCLKTLNILTHKDNESSKRVAQKAGFVANGYRDSSNLFNLEFGK